MQPAENLQQSDLHRAETHVFFLSFLAGLEISFQLMNMGKATIQNTVKAPEVPLKSVAKVMRACKRAGYFWDAQTHGPLCVWASLACAELLKYIQTRLQTSMLIFSI